MIYQLIDTYIYRELKGAPTTHILFLYTFLTTCRCACMYPSVCVVPLQEKPKKVIIYIVAFSPFLCNNNDDGGQSLVIHVKKHVLWL